jgi:hypothetical protein
MEITQAFKIRSFLLTLFISLGLHGQESASAVFRNWGTYFGGKTWRVHDSALDSQGNIYMTGVVYIDPTSQNLAYINQFTTPGAFQPAFGGFSSDAFLAKFNPDGLLVWSTFYGGTGFDEANSIAIDTADEVVITGTTTSVSLATPGALLPTYVALQNQNTGGFIAKFNSNGQRLWGSYFPSTIRDVAIDRQNHIYVTGQTLNQFNVATENAFQDSFQSVGQDHCFLVKLNPDGSRIWGTYYGIGSPLAMAVDEFQNVYLAGLSAETEEDAGFYATPNCHQPTLGYGFLSKFDDNGNRIWSTYYGGINNPLTAIGTIVSGVATNTTDVYISGYSYDTYNIATEGAFKPFTDASGDAFLVRLTPDGQRIWGTYFGGTNEEWTDTFGNLSLTGNSIILSGNTNSTSGLATPDAFNTAFAGQQDSFFARFNTSGERLYASYYGGSGIELTHGCLQFDEERFYVWGSTLSNEGIATNGSFQPALNDGTQNMIPVAENSFLAQFKIEPLSQTDFSAADLVLYPNPNNGSFTLSGASAWNTCKLSLSIYDALGRLIKTIRISNVAVQTFDLRHELQTGVYLAKLHGQNMTVKTFKILVR